jgi:PAT family beta-lactamase induction signal transducer AmpG
MTAPQSTWADAFRAYTKPQVIAMFFLGLSAGLPLLLVFSTLSAWLRDMEVSRSAIGFFGWVGVTYSVKVLWAPIVDRLPIHGLTRWLGQRRSWILLGQLGIMLGIVGMSFTNPQQELFWVAVFAVMVAFSSSTQDIAIDAFRIESAKVELQGAMSATYIFGYRVAMLVAGAGAFYVAEYSSWQMAYWCMAALMGVGVVTVLVVSEPVSNGDDDERAFNGINTAWFVDAVVSPFVDFFRRNGRFALLILAFIAMFRLSDIVMGIMANPFYLDLGFSKTEIANIGKVFGFFMTIAGSFLGGLLVVRYGVFRPLLAGAIMVAVTNLLFAQLSLVGPSLQWLALVISADNLSGGFSNAAFIAYLSGLTNRAYTATQYALFSSLMTLPGKFMSGFSGVVVDADGYFTFFVYAAVMGIPAIVLAYMVMRHDRVSEAN